jgi:acyl carrier protein
MGGGMMESNVPSKEELLEIFQNAYQKVKRTNRQLKVSDRLRDDLDCDSLDVIDMLSFVEEQTGWQVLDAASADLGELPTVERALDAIRARLTSTLAS